MVYCQQLASGKRINRGCQRRAFSHSGGAADGFLHIFHNGLSSRFRLKPGRFHSCSSPLFVKRLRRTCRYRGPRSLRRTCRTGREDLQIHSTGAADTAGILTRRRIQPCRGNIPGRERDHLRAASDLHQPVRRQTPRKGQRHRGGKRLRPAFLTGAGKGQTVVDRFPRAVLLIVNRIRICSRQVRSVRKPEVLHMRLPFLRILSHNIQWALRAPLLCVLIFRGLILRIHLYHADIPDRFRYRLRLCRRRLVFRPLLRKGCCDGLHPICRNLRRHKFQQKHSRKNCGKKLTAPEISFHTKSPSIFFYSVYRWFKLYNTDRFLSIYSGNIF